MRLTGQVLQVPRLRQVIPDARWRVMANKIKVILSQEHALYFERESAPDGTRWAPLKRATLRRAVMAARDKVGGAAAAPVVRRAKDGALEVRATRPIKGYQKRARVRRTNKSKILQDTGLLKASVVSLAGQQAIREVGNYYILWGTRVKYAQAHQYGVPARKLPARPFIGVSRNARQRIMAILRGRR